ncbi:M23 family metallopeptidase [Agilicoccus flavus]|uniref:M23 family metallopeptidase n=1 Tax=Agilicoccus flavus TaxID=2775968 RepID=UPI001CF62636|nr:M23 family metallopeptidase [Agilicoccus flavus]
MSRAAESARAATTARPRTLAPRARAARTPVAASRSRAQTPAAALAARQARFRAAVAGSAGTTRAASTMLPFLRTFAWTTPVAGTHLTSTFGQRWGRLHAGLDFAGPVGTPLRSVCSGHVTFAGQAGGYGNKVEVLCWDGTLARYGHMDRIATRAGRTVRAGGLVGTLGNSGHSTGPHLHLEIRPGGGEPIDPHPWLAARGILPL